MVSPLPPKETLVFHWPGRTSTVTQLLCKKKSNLFFGTFAFCFLPASKIKQVFNKQVWSVKSGQVKHKRILVFLLAVCRFFSPSLSKQKHAKLPNVFASNCSTLWIHGSMFLFVLFSSCCTCFLFLSYSLSLSLSLSVSLFRSP